MKISVIGSGYVGTTTAALLANSGHTVAAIDINQSRVKAINDGKAPFFEAGLDNLITEAVQDKNLSASENYKSLGHADLIFSCVGTPDRPDGSPNLDFINDVANIVSKYAKPGAIFIQKSTVPVGTGTALKSVIKQQTYVSNPEFLREGTAIRDSLLYDRIVIGCDDKTIAKTVEKVFKSIIENSEKINSIAELAIPTEQLNTNVSETIFTSVNSAELIKVTANAFLALKISFANSIAKLADKSDADIVEVMDGVGADKRIGRSFLNAGRGYGGGCFPKDVSGLVSVAINYGVDMGIMNAATDLNQSMPGYIVNKVNETDSLEGKSATVLGLAFKPGTSDARKSPAVEIANLLQKLGSTVIAYDPQANEEAKEYLNSEIKIEDNLKKALSNTDVVFIATDWPEFKEISTATLKKLMSGNLIVDCMNCMDKDSIEKSGLKYVGVGR